MRQVADCVPYQGKNTYFCPGMAQAVSTSIIYNRQFRPFSNDIVKQPTATTWILSAYISFCGTNCATLGSKHPFSPWCGTQSRTRPLQNHARPSANPSRAHDHVRTAPGTGQSRQDGATTTSTDARRRPTRPTSWSYGRTNTRCLRRLLRPERPLMNPPNLTSPLLGLPQGRPATSESQRLAWYQTARPYPSCGRREPGPDTPAKPADPTMRLQSTTRSAAEYPGARMRRARQVCGDCLRR